MASAREVGRPRIAPGALIAGAIAVAAIILSWARSSSVPQYQIASSQAAVVRLDTGSGELIACDKQGCSQIEEPDRAKMAEKLGLRQKPWPPSTAQKIPQQR